MIFRDIFLPSPQAHLGINHDCMKHSNIVDPNHFVMVRMDKLIRKLLELELVNFVRFSFLQLGH